MVPSSAPVGTPGLPLIHPSQLGVKLHHLPANYNPLGLPTPLSKIQSPPHSLQSPTWPGIVPSLAPLPHFFPFTGPLLTELSNTSCPAVPKHSELPPASGPLHCLSSSQENYPPNLFMVAPLPPSGAFSDHLSGMQGSPHSSNRTLSPSQRICFNLGP